jgi:glucose dehydrogenase
MTKRARCTQRLTLAGLLASTALGFCFSAQAAETTYQRLLNAPAEPQNWLMRMGNYSNWNYSTLNQINRSNVANLKVKFMASLGDPTRPNKATEYFTPLVEDGFMYVGNQWQQFWKFDVRNEKATPVWKFDAKVQGGGRSGHSVALLGNNMYFNTNNDTSIPRLVAVDKNSGQVRWCSTSTPRIPRPCPTRDTPARRSRSRT